MPAEQQRFLDIQKKLWERVNAKTLLPPAVSGVLAIAITKTGSDLDAIIDQSIQEFYG